MGVLFQIRDDLLNLEDADMSQKKGFCEDLTEGKFSFPVIHALHADPADDTILSTISCLLEFYDVDACQTS